MQDNPTDVVLLTGNHGINSGLLRWLRVTHPAVAPVLLVDGYDRELSSAPFVEGFAAFFFTHSPFRLLCKCITRVAGGQIWINTEQMHYVLGGLVRD